jgi:hypothetical protein
MTLTKLKRIKALVLAYSTLQLLAWAAGLFPLFVSGYAQLLQLKEKSQRVYIISPASGANFSLTKPEEIFEVTESEEESVTKQKKQHAWSWILRERCLLKGAQPSLGNVSNIASISFARFAAFLFSRVLRI